MDTPTAAPILRDRLNSDAPSVRSSGDSVVNASSCSGVKTRPSPAPWMMIAVMISRWETSGVHPVMRQNDVHISSMPVATR